MLHTDAAGTLTKWTLPWTELTSIRSTLPSLYIVSQEAACLALVRLADVVIMLILFININIFVFYYPQYCAYCSLWWSCPLLHYWLLYYRILPSALWLRMSWWPEMHRSVLPTQLHRGPAVFTRSRLPERRLLLSTFGNPRGGRWGPVQRDRWCGYGPVGHQWRQCLTVQLSGCSFMIGCFVVIVDPKRSARWDDQVLV